MQNLNSLLELAKNAAFEGGKEILKFYKPTRGFDESAYEVFKKPDNSPLTQADLASNDKIFEILSRSDLPICSEERVLSENAGKFWLIDPLDGTRDFINKNGEFCVCIALIEDFRPILGVIYLPISNEIFYAIKNGGFGYEKFQNFCETQEENPPFLAKNLINLSQNSEKKIILAGKYGKNKISNSLAKGLNLELVGISSAIKFCKIAENSAQIYARFSPSFIWDNAAGDIIANEAGGIMIDLATKKPPIYQISNLKSNDFVVISNDFLSKKDEILSLIAQNLHQD